VREPAVMYRNDVKKVRFFRDGDANFSGVNVAISRTKYRNFDSLLSDLSRRVPLPFGVRTLHTPGGVHHVYDIDQIEDGKDYVCSTFHSRPIKKINYTGQHSRESWRPTPRKIDTQFRNERQTSDSGEKLFQTRNLKPKSITVVAKDDSSNRARVILNRKTAMNYESLLQTISDILQMNNGPVKDLYTLDGKKVGGIAGLIHGPDVFLASARSSGSISARSLPSRLLKKKSNSGSQNSSSKSHARSAAIPHRKAKHNFIKASPYTQPVVGKKKETNIKGNPYIFTVKTTDQEDAETEGSITIVVCGSKGSTGELVLGPPSSKKFSPGSTEEFEMDVGSIGKVQKLRISHTAKENETGWHLKEIIMTSLARKSEEYTFQCDRWFSNKEDGDVSLIELPAVVKGKETAKVVHYSVTVMTGEEDAAGTDSNVFIEIVGENGDTGKRWLKKAEDDTALFARGSVDTFDIEAVSLEKIKKIRIGHDNSGSTPGWFLEKVVIKNSENEAEYSFPCRRFLDEDEGDGKTEITIKAITVVDPTMDAEQLWKNISWKFEDSNELVLKSAVNGNLLKISEDGKVLAVEEDSDSSVFTVSAGGETRSRIFTLKTSKHDFNLALDNGAVTGRKGNPGLLSEFFVLPMSDGCIALESVVHRGTLIAVEETGKVKPISVDCEQTKFDVCVKGNLRNLGRMKLKRLERNEIIIEDGGNLYADGDDDDERGEFVVHKIDTGIRSFQSAVTDKYICVTTDGVNCQGENKDNPDCQFRIHKEKQKGVIRLESVKMPGVFLGIGEAGKVKHAVDAGDSTANLSVEITSLGEKSKHDELIGEDDYDANDDFEDDASSGRESSASSASKHSDADYNDNGFEDDNSASPSRRSSAQPGSRASPNEERPPSPRASAASSRAQSAASNVVETNKQEEDQDQDDNNEEMKSSRPASSNSKKEDSRPASPDGEGEGEENELSSRPSSPKKSESPSLIKDENKEIEQENSEEKADEKEDLSIEPDNAAPEMGSEDAIDGTENDGDANSNQEDQEREDSQGLESTQNTGSRPASVSKDESSDVKEEHEKKEENALDDSDNLSRTNVNDDKANNAEESSGDQKEDAGEDAGEEKANEEHVNEAEKSESDQNEDPVKNVEEEKANDEQVNGAEKSESDQNEDPVKNVEEEKANDEQVNEAEKSDSDQNEDPVKDVEEEKTNDEQVNKVEKSNDEQSEGTDEDDLEKKNTSEEQGNEGQLSNDDQNGDADKDVEKDKSDEAALPEDSSQNEERKEENLDEIKSVGDGEGLVENAQEEKESTEPDSTMEEKNDKDTDDLNKDGEIKQNADESHLQEEENNRDEDEKKPDDQDGGSVTEDTEAVPTKENSEVNIVDESKRESEIVNGLIENEDEKIEASSEKPAASHNSVEGANETKEEKKDDASVKKDDDSESSMDKNDAKDSKEEDLRSHEDQTEMNKSEEQMDRDSDKKDMNKADEKGVGINEGDESEEAGGHSERNQGEGLKEESLDSNKNVEDQKHDEDASKERSVIHDSGSKAYNAEDEAKNDNGGKNDNNTENEVIDEKESKGDEKEKIDDNAKTNENANNDADEDEKKANSALEKVQDGENSLAIENDRIEEDEKTANETVNEEYGEENPNNHEEEKADNGNDVENEENNKSEKNKDVSENVISENKDVNNTEGNESIPEDGEDEESQQKAKEDETEMKESNESKPVTTHDENDSNDKKAVNDNGEIAREKEAGANSNEESSPTTQPAISPTPPKTPRRTSTPRRVSSRLSNPSNSRPVSRSSMNSPNKVERNQESTKSKNTDDENAGDRVADDTVKNQTEKENDQGNGSKTVGSYDESKHSNEEAGNVRTDDKMKSPTNTTEQDVGLATEREEKKTEDKENDKENENQQVSHSDDEKPAVDINDNKVEEKNDAEKAEEIEKTASNETKE